MKPEEVEALMDEVAEAGRVYRAALSAAITRLNGISEDDVTHRQWRVKESHLARLKHVLEAVTPKATEEERQAAFNYALQKMYGGKPKRTPPVTGRRSWREPTT